MVLSDVCVHIGLICDNCQMYPVVGKRCTCEDYWEEHTCTGRGDAQKLKSRYTRHCLQLVSHCKAMWTVSSNNVNSQSLVETSILKV
ncbi:hypothetical protein FRX31_025791 [Thalictrum thalictroides]|uniref:Uncharacterized protein n=1 Tax=Thalictrum thalictroides TaxID=46969 RepID=A0A7J6VJY3_THATH|nr:hypothetical protein FRX31_025791 [Thalictrum thalictroides]